MTNQIESSTVGVNMAMEDTKGNDTHENKTASESVIGILTKAKQTMSDVVIEAQRMITERKKEPNTGEVPKEQGEQNIMFQNIVTRVKSLKSRTQSTPKEPTTDDGTPKDNSTNAIYNNVVVDQIKKNATIISEYLVHKKKEFTEDKTKETSHVSESSGTPPASESSPGNTGSPLVRRITSIVNTATASIQKKMEPKKHDAVEEHPIT